MPRQGLDHDRVVAEAAALADAEGIDGVTLAALAARLGVRAPSLYKHVAGADVLGAAVAGRAGRDALEALGRAWVGYARAHPGRYALTVRAADPGDTAYVAAIGRTLGLLGAVVRAPGREGDEELHAIRVVRSALHGFCVTEAGGGFGMPLDVDASLERLLDVLARGLGLDG